LENVHQNISIYNYSDEPQLTTQQIVNIIKNSLSRSKSVIIPYYCAYAIGLCFDLLSFLSSINLPISSKRIKKLCSETYCVANKIINDGFKPLYSSIEGLQKMIEWYKDLKQRGGF
jgi:nucleoside-diphosphate-sugar epimerase